KGNVLQLFTVFAAIIATVGAACGADAIFAYVRKRRQLWCAVTGAAVFATLAWVSYSMRWNQVGRALPLTTAAALIVLTVACARRRDERAPLARVLPVAMWAMFALLLLSKVVLKVRLSHYGFVLAMPATVLLVAWLTGVIPAWLRARNGGGSLA